ncbi:hypothetical protein [Ruminococcus sp.]|uniref:hypothetical protein n=1 Tax=Ruminococcus sp. TaxID=41978 RepID=UPI001B725204|nr:hypothetical protein [Ruminococcus sp.]MBP5433615.1 hypothetical protein [Ruminococcus sp.]
MAKKQEMIVPTSEGDMKITVMNITPTRAAEFLSFNTHNRNIREKRVKVYADEMKAKQWRANGVPIIVGNDGELKDGQHRLQAIIVSGVTMKNAVVIYLPENNANCYDIGAGRSAKDVARFMGLDDIPVFRNNNLFAAVNNAIHHGNVKSVSSKTHLIEEMTKHTDACEFVYYRILTGCGNVTKVKRSQLCAAIFNAYIAGYDLEMLQRFCTVLIHGICRDEKEAVIISLRDHVLNTPRENTGSLYYKTQAVLHAYANGQDKVDLKKANTEYYIYPGNDKEE